MNTEDLIEYCNLNYCFFFFKFAFNFSKFLPDDDQAVPIETSEPIKT